MLGLSNKVGIETSTRRRATPSRRRSRARNARDPIGPAEAVALRELRTLGGDGAGLHRARRPAEVRPVGRRRSTRALEDHVVDAGWFAEKPSKVVGSLGRQGRPRDRRGRSRDLHRGQRPDRRACVLIGGAAIAGGIVVCLFAQGMPAVTMPGAMIRAMLAAYRRTLEKTMEQARSMQQVVDEAGLDLARDARPGGRVGHGARAAGSRSRASCSASLEDVQQQPSLGARRPTSRSGTDTSDGSSFASGVAAGSGGSIFSGSAVPGPRRDDVGARARSGTRPRRRAAAAVGGGFSGGGGGGGGGWRRRRPRTPATRTRPSYAPNISRHASRPSMATGGRGRDRHDSAGHPEASASRAGRPAAPAIRRPFSS